MRKALDTYDQAVAKKDVETVRSLLAPDLLLYEHCVRNDGAKDAFENHLRPSKTRGLSFSGLRITASPELGSSRGNTASGVRSKERPSTRLSRASMSQSKIGSIRQRWLGRADLLAQRLRSDPWTAAANTIHRRNNRQCVPLRVRVYPERLRLSSRFSRRSGILRMDTVMGSMELRGSHK